MIVIIIAGGSGSRLWPLSTQAYPKHLLSLTNDKSLLQNTFERVSGIAPLSQIFVITEASHSRHVNDQLKDLSPENILIEPARRGTASCVALGLAEVAKRGFDKDEPVFFLWADHIIRDSDGFTAAVLKAGEVARDQQKIVFMGAEPTYPSTKFGYIKKGQEIANWYQIYEFGCFVEKPNKQKAEQYLEDGKHLWNMGYLTGTLVAFEKAMEDYSDDMMHRYKLLVASNDLEKDYLSLENIAVEYVFSEKLKNALVIPGAFDWVDVGSFGDLHDMSVHDDAGNHVRGVNIAVELTTNSLIRNETDIPLAVIGLDNVIVVQTPDGVLVTNKNFDQKVGDVAKKLQK